MFSRTVPIPFSMGSSPRVVLPAQEIELFLYFALAVEQSTGNDDSELEEFVRRYAPCQCLFARIIEGSDVRRNIESESNA